MKRTWSDFETRIVRGFAYLVYRGEITKYKACKDLVYICSYHGKRTWSSVYSKFQRELKTCG